MLAVVQLDTKSHEERRVPIVLGGVSCEGGEDSLLSCPGAVLGEGSRRCGIKEAVAVICFNELDACAALPLAEPHSIVTKCCHSLKSEREKPHSGAESQSIP